MRKGSPNEARGDAAATIHAAAAEAARLDNQVQNVGDGDPVVGEPQPPPQVKRYRVLEAKRVQLNTGPVDLQAGKVLTSITYDVPALRAQGVKVERIDEAGEVIPGD